MIMLMMLMMLMITKKKKKKNKNKNALSSVESRVFVEAISSDEANRAQAFVIRRGGSAYKRAGDARRLA